jgi:hypothetical protein
MIRFFFHSYCCCYSLNNNNNKSRKINDCIFSFSFQVYEMFSREKRIVFVVVALNKEYFYEIEIYWLVFCCFCHRTASVWVFNVVFIELYVGKITKRQRVMVKGKLLDWWKKNSFSYFRTSYAFYNIILRPLFDCEAHVTDTKIDVYKYNLIQNHYYIILFPFFPFSLFMIDNNLWFFKSILTINKKKNNNNKLDNDFIYFFM